MTDDDFSWRHALFQAAWELADADTYRRRHPWAWVKRLTVCWWKHRPRKVDPGTYVSVSCRACVAGRRRV